MLLSLLLAVTSCAGDIEDDAVRFAKKYIDRLLKAPATAKYECTETKYENSFDSITIKGTVDSAKQFFGAYPRATWFLRLKKIPMDRPSDAHIRRQRRCNNTGV